ncbi:MAG TPA: enoyl-CoA hydratase/isomerase family protein [Chloroflexota bacterium]|jgi:enoyl-CoA hydratase|nr:enoyl-CoA hydratase/isomerase family protein [Chloroflexota bacterium]
MDEQPPPAAPGGMTRIDLGTPDLIFEIEAPLATLTFNRPGARNAMTWAMYDGLSRACAWVEQQAHIRVLLLQGAGERAFVAGTDISQFQAFRNREDALRYEARMDDVLGRLEGVRQPTIALIRGYAVGAGMAISMACDLRLCAPDARIGVPIARTLGNCLSLSNYARLVALLGPARTKELIFTARMIGAEEAQQIGLASEIVPADQLQRRGRELALTIAGHAPLTLQTTKEAVRRLLARQRLPRGGAQPAAAGADGTADPTDDELILRCYLSEDFQEGVRAFLEKRQAQWQGR